jgi:uncharacterized protein (DUF302 family)
MSYAISRTVPLTVDEADAAVREALAAEGFGVLTEIDVKATLAKKLGVDVPEHRILGACNPSFAHQGIEAEPDLSVLLPCNVTVRAEGGATVVSAVDPVVQLGVTGNEQLVEIATEVRASLERAIAAVG